MKTNKIPPDMKKGTVFNSNKSGKFYVVNYIDGNNVEVEFFDTGYKFVARSQAIRKGNIKDPTARVIHGVACFGVGDFAASKNGKTSIAYNKWNNMLIRCYDDDYQSSKPTYKGCYVCDEWLNFQNFAKWFYDNYPNDGHQYCLDKDLTVIGNKVYSPDTCIFVSNQVNCFVTDSAAARGQYMIGVSMPKRGSRFKSYCHNPFTGSRGYIGYSETEKGAHMMWRERKSHFANELSKIQTDRKVRDGLLNYKNALDNFEIYKDGFNYE